MKNPYIVFVVSFLAFLFLGGFFVWQGIFWPKQFRITQEIPFKVENGEGLFSISENLERKNLIKDKFFFQLYVVLKKKYGNLGVGTYFLSPSMSVADIAKNIFGGKSISAKITIPEGFTITQIENTLISNLEYPAFAKASAGGQVSNLHLEIQSLKSYKNEFGFLKDAPDNASLEGFMFPDTYFFDVSVEEKEIFVAFLENFDKKLTPQLRSDIEKQQKTIFDVVTMASLLEKEVKTLEEKKIVSGILWKRLNANIPLQVDATIIYITNKKTTKISRAETQIDSPYNTYKYLGLPQGPICNPGLESIEAAVLPEQSVFWYYLSMPDGKTIFSKTIEEHNIAKAKYLE